MDNPQQLLQLSAKLYQLLETVPNGDERDKFLEEVDRLLEERGKVIDILREEQFKMDSQNKMHSLLIELDKGILERLDVVMKTVKSDMKNFQTTKKKEQQYINPYASVQVMDGRYYDRKK